MVRRERTGLECVDYIEDWCSKDNLQTPYMQLHTIRKELKLLEKIKKFIWVENDELIVGRFGDIEITLSVDDFESQEDYDLVKGALK